MDLEASLKLWREREARFRKNWRSKAKGDPRRAYWYGQLVNAKRMVARRVQQIGEQTATPNIVTAADLGLKFQYLWGGKGPLVNGAGHYTAGHRAKDEDALRAEMKSDHNFHASKGWGGLSYEVMIADDGTIGFGNPMTRKSAAVALHNTGLVSVCCPGTTGDRISAGQKASWKWLMAHWHTTKVPAAHRLPRKATSLRWRVHKDFPDQSTACPGDMKPDYLELF